VSEPARPGRDHGNSRDPEELKKAWVGWHQIAIPIRKDYVRFVELSNKGAKEMGFKDTGAMWRSKYDMEPDAFAAEMERCGNRSSRFTTRFTPTRAASFLRSTAKRSSVKTNRSRRTCSETCGRKPGATSIRCSRPQMRIAVTI
jgi:hypothetical protein